MEKDQDMTIDDAKAQEIEEIHPLEKTLSLDALKKEEEKKGDLQEEDTPSKPSVESEPPKEEGTGEKPKTQNISDDYSPLKEPDAEDKKEKTPDSSQQEDRLKHARGEFSKISNKMNNALKLIQKMEEEGDFTAGEAEKIKAALTHDIPASFKEEDKEESGNPFAKLLKAANPEIENMRKYVEDENFNDYLISFNRWMVADASPQNRKELMEHLEELSDDPALLAKKTVALGKRLFNDLYKDIKEVGGIPSLIKKHKDQILSKDEEIEKLKKRIDKLEKKNNDEKDFITSDTYKLDGRKDPKLKSGGFAPGYNENKHPLQDQINSF